MEWKDKQVELAMGEFFDCKITIVDLRQAKILNVICTKNLVLNNDIKISGAVILLQYISARCNFTK
jgi:hypothetical protein